jgi:hypothetical protein
MKALETDENFSCFNIVAIVFLHLVQEYQRVPTVPDQANDLKIKSCKLSQKLKKFREYL